MKDFDDIYSLLSEILEKNQFLDATLSSPLFNQEIKKAQIRFVSIKNKQMYQVSTYSGEQVFHENFSSLQCFEWIQQHLQKFKQTIVHTTAMDYHILINKKGNVTLLKKQPSKVVQNTMHNRKKTYLLNEGEPCSFLHHLGIMNEQGKVYPNKQDKFRQINRFLEMVDDILPHISHLKSLHVVDFGCGKAYLTFSLFYFLKFVKGFSVKMWGLDLKQKVIEDCQELAKSLEVEQDLHFVNQDIQKFEIENEIDLMVSLHACDVATDAALEKAVRWNAKVILSAPCCQHELLSQIVQPSLEPLLKHGILRERFASLSTDAVRSQLLEVVGYQTQIVEFIDAEHTPKNLMIRAVKKGKSELQKRVAWDVYVKFKEYLGIRPCLEEYLRDFLFIR
jgi:SAM-dependent methyltransferase